MIQPNRVDAKSKIGDYQEVSILWFTNLNGSLGEPH